MYPEMRNGTQNTKGTEMNVTATKKMQKVAENNGVTVEQVANEAFANENFRKVHCFGFSQANFSFKTPNTTSFRFRVWEKGEQDWTVRTVRVR